MKTELEFAIELAHEAGEIMLEYFKIGVAHIPKHDKSPVTEADIKINDLVIEKVKQNFPDHAVLGEEASWNLPAKYTWVCDPIDGTRPFVYGLPYSVFSLALVEDGQPIIAIAYDPYSKRLYHAEKGKGAFMNEQKISVNNKSDLAGAIVGAGKHLPFENLNYTKLFEQIIDKIHRTITLQCVVQEAMLIATGQVEGNIFISDTAHDIAAVKLLVEEAGGKVTDLYGNEQRYDQPIRGAIISNGHIHDELLAIIKASAS